MKACENCKDKLLTVGLSPIMAMNAKAIDVASVCDECLVSVVSEIFRMA